MPGLVPGIHVFASTNKTWMAGTSSAMTLGHLHRRNIAVAAEVAGAGENAGCRIAHDALHAADQHLLPRRADVDFVAACTEARDRRGRDARFDQHAPSVPQPRAR